MVLQIVYHSVKMQKKKKKKKKNLVLLLLLLLMTMKMTMVMIMMMTSMTINVLILLLAETVPAFRLSMTTVCNLHMMFPLILYDDIGCVLQRVAPFLHACLCCVFESTKLSRYDHTSHTFSPEETKKEFIRMSISRCKSWFFFFER